MIAILRILHDDVRVWALDEEPQGQEDQRPHRERLGRPIGEGETKPGDGIDLVRHPRRKGGNRAEDHRFESDMVDKHRTLSTVESPDRP